MIPFVFIFAFIVDPVGSILDEPWDYVEEVEVIDLGPSLEEMERQLQRQNKRIMEFKNMECDE
jgi:hypothetical protein